MLVSTNKETLKLISHFFINRRKFINQLHNFKFYSISINGEVYTARG